jgi:hypothetical protein
MKFKPWMVAIPVALGVAGYAFYAKAKPKIPPPPSAQKSVQKAITILGPKGSIEIADLAYTMAYPKCPKKLDPKNANHADCIAKWLKLREIALVELPKSSSNDNDTGPGPADDMVEWLDSLTSSQKSGLKKLIGDEHYTDIDTSARSGNDSKTVSAVLRFKSDIELLVEEHPLDAFAKYRDLKELLGPKLEELLKKAQKYK